MLERKVRDIKTPFNRNLNYKSTLQIIRQLSGGPVSNAFWPMGWTKRQFSHLRLLDSSTKKSVPKQFRIPNVRFDNFGYPVEFPQKNKCPNKPGFPLFALIILVWYPYVSLFPNLLCNVGLSVSGFRKIRFNAYFHKNISSQTDQDSRCLRW